MNQRRRISILLLAASLLATGCRREAIAPATARASPERTVEPPLVPAPHRQQLHPAPPPPARASPSDTAVTKTLLGSARSALGRGDDRAAQMLVDDALGIDPTEPESHHLSGRLHFRAARYDEAIAAFERALELAPDHAFAHNGKGLSHLRLGQWSEALHALGAATRLRPDVAYMHRNLGIAWERLGYASEALAEYRMAVMLDPDDEKAQTNYQRLGALPWAQLAELGRTAPRHRPALAPEGPVCASCARMPALPGE